MKRKRVNEEKAIVPPIYLWFYPFKNPPRTGTQRSSHRDDVEFVGHEVFAWPVVLVRRVHAQV